MSFLNFLENMFSGNNVVYTVIGIVLGVTLIAFILILVLFHKIKNIVSFMYLNSLVRVIGSPLLEEDSLKDMVDVKGPEELVYKLRSRGVKIEGIPESLEEVDKVVNSYKYELIEKVRRYAPTGIHPFLEAYFALLKAEELIKAIRCLRAGVKPKVEFLKMLDPETAHIVESSESLEDFYEKLLERGISLPRGPIEVESHLMKKAIEEMLNSVQRVDESIANPINDFVLEVIDYENMKILIRGKALGYESSYLEQLFLGEGMNFSSWRLHQLAETSSLHELASELHGTEYGEEVRALVEKKIYDLSEIEGAIDRAFLKVIEGLSQKYSLTVGPLLYSLVARKLEARNLKTLLIGVMEALPKERVSALLVGERR